MKNSSILAGFLYGFFSMVLIPLVLVYLNNYWQLPKLENAYLQLVGFLSVVIGIILGLYAASIFAKNGKGGSPLPFDPPKKLITSGAFKYIRNPMFTGSALVWFGELFFLGSILLLPYAIVWVLFNHIHLILQDEKWLKKRFGKEYLEYKKATPYRYVPYLF